MTQGLNFNNVQRPQQRSPIIRVQGVDTPNPQFGQTLQSGNEINLPDITDEKFAEIREAQQRTFEAIANANKAEAEARIADLKAQGHSPEGQALGGLAQEIATTAKIIEKRKLKEAEAEAELAKARREQRQAQIQTVARGELQRQIREFQQTSRKAGLKQGVDKFRREGQEIISKFQDELAPQQVQELQDMFHQTLNNAESDLTDRHMEQMQQARDTQNQIDTQKILLQLEGDLASIKSADDPEVLNKRIKDAMKKARRLAPDKATEPQKFANVFLPILKNIRDSASSSSQAIAEANAWIRQSQDYAKEAKKVYEKYNAGEINGDTLQFRLKQIANAKGVPQLAGNVFSTNQERYQQEVDRLQTQKKLKELAESDNSAVSRDMLSKFTNAELGRLVHSYHTGDKETWLEIERALNTEENPLMERFVKELSKQLPKDRQEMLNLQEDTLKLMADISEQKLDNRELIFNEDFIPKPVYKEDINRWVLPERSQAVEDFAKKNNISRQQARNVLSTLIKRKQNLIKRMSTLKNKWANYGINIENLEDTSKLAEQQEAIKPLIEETKRQPRPQTKDFPMRNGRVPNPNSGATGKPSTPTVASLASSPDGVFVRPFSKEDQDKVQVGDGYGMRTHPITGEQQSLHNGVDYSAPMGTPVKTIQGGKVLFNKFIRGFGKTVAVQTPDGRTEMFAHLNDFNVQQGQEIPPGTTIGKVGSTGNSTGAHLHFQVWKGKPGWGGRSEQHADTLNPAQYLRETNLTHAEPRGQGAPPNQKMPGGDSAVGNQPNKNRDVREQHNEGNPMRAKKLASTRKSHYPTKNDLNNNYGYETLKNDPDFARKINQVANDIGIPGQWLADVMAHETDGTFRPDIQSYDPTIDSVGLIQFTSNTAELLGTTTRELEKLSRVEQMEWVRKYLSEFKGRIKTIDDLVRAIYGGAPALRNNVSFKQNKKFRQYFENLGSHVGRQYRMPWNRDDRNNQQLHSKAVDGCSQCNQMLRKNGFIVPHYAS